MNSIMTVVKFTFLNRFRTKAFKAATIIFAVLISIGINLPSIISAFSSDKPMNVGVLANGTDIPGQIEQYYAKQEKPDLKIILIPEAGSLETNERAAKALIEEKEIQGYVQLTDDKANGFPKVVYKSEGTSEQGVKNKLQGAMQQIKFERVAKEAGLTDEQKTRLFTPVLIENEQITLKTGDAVQGKNENQIGLAKTLVYVLIILFFISLQMYGQLIATEVTAEKSSRVMELLISSISPLKQMFGKVIGMLLLAIVQLLGLAIIVIINLNLPNNSDFMMKNGIKISDIPVSLLVYFFLFFILGFFLYAMLYAAVGSLVSRTEDLGQAIAPVLFLMMGGYFIGIYGISNPTSSPTKAMSFVPFFTPMIMFLRIGLTNPALWQILIALVVLIVTIFAAAWLSAKIYRVGVLMYGKKPSIREVVKAMRAYRA